MLQADQSLLKLIRSEAGGLQVIQNQNKQKYITNKPILRCGTESSLLNRRIS